MSATKKKPTYRQLAQLVERLEKRLAEQDAIIAKQNRTIAELEKKLTEQDTIIAKLEKQLAAAKKNSRNSSKPPSSDITKPPPPKNGRRAKRKIGGQPGHQKHARKPFAPEEIDRVREYAPQCCHDCGGQLHDEGKATILQQAELVERPVRVTEHRATPRRCPDCGKKIDTKIPRQIRAGGLCGPNLTALAAYLKSIAHASVTTVQTFFGDVLHLPVSSGFVCKMIAKTAAALGEPYEQILTTLPTAASVNVDETGHKENGRRQWTWVFRTGDYTVFRIADTRSASVLDETLGAEFAGFLGADYYAAYRAFRQKSDAQMQFCLAHLIRDVRFLTESTDKVTANYGARVLECLRNLFHLWHRRAELTRASFQHRLESAGEKLVQTAKRAPPRNEAQNLAKRFREHGGEYIRFIFHPEIAPTNNAAEQALRFCVIDRRITQGTRGEAGRQWCERVWSTIATCRSSGRSSWQFLNEAIAANFRHHPAPSLLT